VITFKNVSKKYDDDSFAILNTSFGVHEGETLVLLGRSGSGKTTLLKMINRLIEPTSGSIFIDGKNILDKDPVELRRQIGYAIQHIGLFPHMSVAENIAVVPTLLDWPKAKIDDTVDHLLSLVGLEPADFRLRYPHELSGGQAQGVGVARSLAADPPIILMDEPFGALDPITRQKLRRTFIEVESVMKKSVVFVTHDIFEALYLGDRIGVIDNGKLVQLATPKELIANPATDYVKEFLSHYKAKEELCCT